MEPGRGNKTVRGSRQHGAERGRRNEFAGGFGQTDRRQTVPCDNFLRGAELGRRSPTMAKRRWLLWLAGLIAAAGFLGLALTTPAPAHSWYDGDCCGHDDCEPISGGYVDKVDGKTYYTTKLGTYAVVPDHVVVDGVTRFQTKIRPSKDSQTHACVYQNQLWCLYVPGGM